MLRMCDTLTASFMQFYATIVAATTALTVANAKPPHWATFGYILGATSFVFGVLSGRIRRNYANYVDAAEKIEAAMSAGAPDGLAGPHSLNRARMRERFRLSNFRMSWVPMRVLYPTFYACGGVAAVVIIATHLGGA